MVRLAIPTLGHGTFYEVKGSVDVPRGKHFTAKDFTVQIKNLASLPGNIRAAYLPTKPTGSGSKRTEDFWVAINYPTSLVDGPRAAAADYGESDAEVLADLFFGDWKGPLREEMASCAAAKLAAEKAGWVDTDRWPTTGNTIAHFAADKCQRP